MLDLPPELVLYILAYLPLSSLVDLSLVSRPWHKFIRINESPIYHKAAQLHGYAQSTERTFAEAAGRYSQRSVGTVTSWKELCRKRYCIGKNWSGYGPSQITPHCGTGKSVHRIKVDETAGYILTTSSLGGFSVTGLLRGEKIWSLPDSHVRPYAHCEYGEGFVVFDYIDGSKEVWRRADDYNDDEAALVVNESLPCTRQHRAYAAALQKYQAASPSSWGHFRPWAILSPPQTTRAFRFSYPFLGAAAWDSIYLWDVRTGALVQAINQTQLGVEENDNLEFLGDINYIEVSEKYVFLCGIHSLRVFSRETSRPVLDISSSKHPHAAWHFTILPHRPEQTFHGACLITEELQPTYVEYEEAIMVDEFIAVHISPCGSHLATLMLSSRLLIIRNFEKAFQSNTTSYELSIEVQLGSPCRSSRYLAFEHDRIAVATKTGVFIVEADWSSSSIFSSEEPPFLRVSRVPTLGDRPCLGAISCLQMTDTGLFLNWDIDYLNAVNDEISEGMENAFYDSVAEVPRYASLANGFQVNLVDLEEPELDPESSSVISVDFVPNA